MAQDFTIPQAKSVQDFLTAQGKDGSYGARKKLYTDMGINTRLGDFAGTPSQNSALLKQLQTPATATPATNLLSMGATAKKPVDFGAINMKSAPVKAAPTPAKDMFGMMTTTPAVAQKTPAASVLESFKGTTAPDFSKYTDVTPKAPVAPATATVAAAGAQAPATPPTPSAPGTGTTTKTPQVDYAASLGLDINSIIGNDNPSEGDLVNQFLDSEEGKALADKIERGELDAIGATTEAKRLLDLKYSEERSTLEAKLAKNGLAFSGIRSSQLKALADNLAASELNTDRLLASKLLDADANMREGILKGVEELIKEAADGRKEAIQQLNAVGLAVVGNHLVPTLSAIKEENDQIRAQASSDRADAQLAMSERRLQLAEEAAIRSEQRFEQLYGAGKNDGFAYARNLLELNPTATVAELKVALLENTNLSSTEADAALALQGLPQQLQPTVAASFIASSFTQPGVLSRLMPGNQSAGALNKAKDAAKKALLSTGGVLPIKVGGTTRTYNLTSDQLQALSNMVDTISLKDVQELKTKLDAEAKK